MVFAGFSPAQKSPFNGLTIPDSTGNNYSFLISGHFHGSSSNLSGFPAASLLSNLDLINESKATFMMSTGDLFLDVTKDIPLYKKSFFDKLQIPLFNVVGNHDLSGKVYQQNFGPTWSAFRLSTEQFIFLDTEEEDGKIIHEQQAFLSNELTIAGKDPGIKNIFIFSHRPVWAENNEKLKNVFQGNTRSATNNNFNTTILPTLKELAGKKNIYWVSGSLGGNAPASFFYYTDENNITFIQTAIRDLPRDGMIKVNVTGGKIAFETISFTLQPMPKLEDCGLDMWKTHPSENPFSWRLVPLYLKQMFFHRYFWYGIGYTLLGLIILYFIRKRIKRKKIA